MALKTTTFYTINGHLKQIKTQCRTHKHTLQHTPTHRHGTDDVAYGRVEADRRNGG